MNRSVCVAGMIIDLAPIPGADFIVLATVVCGSSGKWMGVVKKNEFQLKQYVVVFLQDAVLPQQPEYEFMRSRHFLVKMCRFKGVPSECVIIAAPFHCLNCELGYCLMERLGVTKFEKSIPSDLMGAVKGSFPGFIPKTDEPNFQTVPEQVAEINKQDFYIALKYDGTSCTAYKYQGEFGVCSRNWELKEGNNVYWRVAQLYNLAETLPEGIAVQFEVCGPKIQKNVHGLKNPNGFLFQAYDIEKRRYLDFQQLLKLQETIKMPLVKIFSLQEPLDDTKLRELSAQIAQLDGKPLEGIVIRSCHVKPDGSRLSFKVINLNYKD